LSRLAPLDKVLVLILVPLWAICFGLGVRAQVRGGGVAFVGLSVEDAESYPALTGEFDVTVHSSDPLAEAGLRVGDRLVRLGDADLLGVGTVGFAARTLDEAGRDRSVPLVFERNGVRREISLALAYFGMCAAINGAVFPGSRLQWYASFGVILASQSVYFPLLAHFLFRFPDDRVPEGRWHQIWPWFFSLPLPLFFGLALTGWMTVGWMGFGTTIVLGVVAALAVATRKFRRADLVARRQMKWVLFGFYCAGLSFTVGVAAPVLDPRLGWLWFASFGAAPLFPLSLVVSVVRFNLFDIDRILSAAASYNILLVLLLGGGLVVVPRVAEAASGLVGIDPGTGQVALSLALAAVLIPAHRRLRPQIDRVFFKERYALDQGIAELLPTLSSCTDTRELTERAGSGLHDLLRPEACVVYAGVEQSYAPVFVEGRAVPPAFAARSPLIVSLEERRGPLALGEAGRRPDAAALSPFDRAALETLQAEVVVPVQQDDALAAFLCLGPKRSGDVYTSTDLSHLAAVAEKVSTELRRFDQDEVIREGREMQESLRRYVPGAVAEQLPSGAELTSGEREVSVLFVDLRGYVGFAERRRAEEIFSTVNRYTETVSQIVQMHAGNVVEFAQGGPTKLSVGVGIATGEAFVGNIQAVDRMIWSAIGNTTNLAARLQSLTRDLDALLVIDGGTWERAQPAAEDFEKRSEVPIRGRRETQDVYALPMRSDS
jgi:class 3 adenylate cyclase